MLLLPGLLVQLVLRVLDVSLDRHSFIPGGLRFNTGNIDNLFYDGAAIGKMLDRDVMADLLNSSNRVMVHDLHVIHQQSKRQVGFTSQLNAVFINNFHIHPTLCQIFTA